MDNNEILAEPSDQEIKEEPPKKENILKQYEDLSPIDLVDTIERYYHTFLPSSDKDSLHILSSYKSKTNVKFQLLFFDTKQNLSYTLKSKIRNITCLKIKEDNLLAGDKEGNVILYSIEKGIEIKSFIPQEKVIDFYPTSIDITPNLDFIVIGYSNGFISLWDGIKGQLIYTIKNVQKTKILIVQFCSISEKKYFEFLSTDESGQLLKIMLTLKFLKKSVQDNLIYKDSVPTYAMTQFRPIREKPIVLGAFANINKIRIYILRPCLLSFFEIERPDFIPEDAKLVPDISFGWGCPPLESNDILETQGIEQIRENTIILAVTWSNVISLYSMRIQGEDIVLNGEGPTSYFVNDSPVVRLGFVSPSIIYFFNESGMIKIMNTAFTTYGEYNKDDKESNIYNKTALVDEGKIIDEDLISLDVSNNESFQKNCFRYFINNMNKRIFLLTRNGFILGNVLNFQDCIDNLAKENNWFGAMCLGLDIYQGNITSFPDVPIDRKQRYQLLSPYLIELLNKYIDENMKENKDSKETNEEKQKKLVKCMNVTIEFCIGIKDVNYLLRNVEETFKAKGKIDLFYKLLEPFIFNDLLSQEELSEDSLIALFTTYKGNNELSLLSHLFSHFSLHSLSNSTIKKIALKEHLFSIMILIYSNSTKWEDYFLPVAKMYKTFETKIKKEEIKYVSYMDMCKSNSIKDINNIELSTEYIGHKLLWYIDMTLKGNKYSLAMDVNLLKFDTQSEEYKNFICTLYYWVLQDDVFMNLMKFDSYSFFNIMSSFINDSYNAKIIKKYDFKKINPKLLEKIQEEKDSFFLSKNSTEISNEEENVEKITITLKRNGKELDYNKSNNIINNIIIPLVEKNKSFFTEIDFSLFLIKFASRCTELNPVVGPAKKYIVSGIKKLLSFYEEYQRLKQENSNEAKDVFNCHKLDKYLLEEKIDKNNLFYKEINKSLRDFLDSEYQLRKEELEDIITVCKNSPFILVKIKLYELSKRYTECLENYLNPELDETIDEDVFSWLQNIFTSFSRKNIDRGVDDLKNLQQSFIDKIDILSKKSVVKTNKIIKQFYGSKEKMIIIHKLDSLPSLQYELLRQLICPSKGGNIEEISKNVNNEIQDNKNKIEENDDKKNNDSLCDLLLLQIDLLIKLNKINEVLPSIKEQIKIYPNSYPKQKCLEKCLENKINDAAVYLYQCLGKNDSALSLTKEQTEKAFNMFLTDGKEESYNYFLEQLNLCIKICQYTSESLAKEKLVNKDINIKEGDALWFDLLKTLYNFEKKCTNKDSEKKISENIEDLLRKMCLHVSLQNIIETVTEIQKDAQYKEFKNILGDMLRSNNSFNRILENTKLILKHSSIISEEERSQSSIRGNCYNNKICDVCHKNFVKSKNENITCFGCGHQSHEKCAFCSNHIEECAICRREGIGDEIVLKNEIVKKKTEKKEEKEKEKKEDKEENKIIEKGKKNKKDKKAFMFGIRDDKIKMLKDLDKKYIEKVIEIF